MTKQQALTWDDLANLYDKANGGGRPARTLQINSIFQWAENQPDKFFIDPKEGTLHLISKETN